MKGLRIVSRVFLTLIAIASAVLWFFPVAQLSDAVSNGMESLNSVMQIFTTNADQSAVVSKVLSDTEYSFFDLEQISKTILSMLGSLNGTLLESVEDVETLRNYLTGFRILVIALLCLAAFFGFRAMVNHCFGYVLFPLTQVAALLAVALLAMTINDKVGSEIIEFSYFFYVQALLAVVALFFWVFAQISGLSTNKNKLYTSNSEKRSKKTVAILSVLMFFICCGGGALLYFII